MFISNCWLHWFLVLNNGNLFHVSIYLNNRKICLIENNCCLHMSFFLSLFKYNMWIHCFLNNRNRLSVIKFQVDDTIANIWKHWKLSKSHNHIYYNYSTNISKIILFLCPLLSLEVYFKYLSSPIFSTNYVKHAISFWCIFYSLKYSKFINEFYLPYININI